MMTIRVECGLLVLLASFNVSFRWLSRGQVVVVSGSVEMVHVAPFFVPIFNFYALTTLSNIHYLLIDAPSFSV